MADLVLSALPRLARRRGLLELAIFGCIYLAYELLRGHADRAADQALENARSVLALQGAAGWVIEHTLRQLVGQAPVLLDVLSVVYLLAQGVVVPAALVALWWSHRPAYRHLRTAVVICWTVALPVYRLFPTAPPRLAEIGVLDAVSAGTPLDLDGPLARSFYNPYAAVPSLHVALALVVGASLWIASRRWWVRLAGGLWPFVVSVSVIATGNHYAFDVASGAALGLIAFALAAYGPLALRGLRRPRRAGASSRGPGVS